MSNQIDRAGVVLDTSAAIDIMDEWAAIRRRAERSLSGAWDAVRTASEWVLPVPVVGELIYGALNSTRRAENIARVEAFISRCRVVDSTLRTAREYANVRRDLSQRGRLIPENDIWIAASCLESRLPLATSDPHFDDVPGLDLRRT